MELIDRLADIRFGAETPAALARNAEGRGKWHGIRKCRQRRPRWPVVVDQQTLREIADE